MTLENLVPPLAECKRIPSGSFADSALVWRKTKEHIKRFDVFPRECGECSQYSATSEVYPAPTLAEIMSELTTVGCVVRVSEVGGNVEYTTSILLSDIEETNKNPATAALRLWFCLRGVQG